MYQERIKYIHIAIPNFIMSKVCVMMIEVNVLYIGVDINIFKMTDKLHGNVTHT